MKAKVINTTSIAVVSAFGVFALWYIATAVRMVIESGAWKGH